MVFLTGCDIVPPLGSGSARPSIIVVDKEMLPKVSTCSLCLTLPLNLTVTFDKFKEKMDFTILGSQVFFG